jgi:hypothetical protein
MHPMDENSSTVQRGQQPIGRGLTRLPIRYHTMKDTVIAMHAEGKSRDEIIIHLVVSEGITINKATAEYAKIAKEQGWTKAVVSHKESAVAHLTQTVTDWTYEDMVSHAIQLVEMYGVTDSTARDYCKAYSKAQGIKHPVRDDRALMFDFLLENAGMEYDELKAAFKAYAKDELGRSASNINEYWKGYDLHLALTKAAAARAAAANMDPAVREAWDNLNAAKANPAGVKRNAFHPDKVSHLGDAALNDAYTEFFKTFS